MRKVYRRLLLGLVAFGVLLICLAALYVSMWKQGADPDFDARVSRPAYVEEHPKVLFDEAHFNFHTLDGRYEPFANLLSNDGYQMVPNKERFSESTLRGYNILVIANARGAESGERSSHPAFAEEECDVVANWVREGGSLLLIADHAPYGAAAENLARRFGVEMSNTDTVDASNHDLITGNEGFLVFSRENQLLREHPITRGRDAGEMIHRVLTFNGQSLNGPEGSTAFLALADTAVDVSRDGSRNSAAGRAQGIAMEFGGGRVVVLGEAAMLTAQLAQIPFREPIRAGMNREDSDNRQLALNIMHWLSRLLN